MDSLNQGLQSNQNVAQSKNQPFRNKYFTAFRQLPVFWPITKNIISLPCSSFHTQTLLVFLQNTVQSFAKFYSHLLSWSKFCIFLWNYTPKEMYVTEVFAGLVLVCQCLCPCPESFKKTSRNGLRSSITLQNTLNYSAASPSVAGVCGYVYVCVCCSNFY